MSRNRKEAGVLEKEHGAWTGEAHSEVRKRSWGRSCLADPSKELAFSSKLSRQALKGCQLER